MIILVRLGWLMTLSINFLSKVPLDQGSFGQGSFGPRFLQPRFLWTKVPLAKVPLDQGSFELRFLWTKVPLDQGSFGQGSFGSRFLCQGSFGPGSFGSGSFSQGSSHPESVVCILTYNFGQSTTYTMYKCWGFLLAQADVLPFQHFLKIYLSAMCSDGCYSSQVLESKGNVVRSSLLAKLNQNLRQKTAPEKPFSEQTAYNYETAVGNPTMRRRRYCSQHL